MIISIMIQELQIINVIIMILVQVEWMNEWFDHPDITNDWILKELWWCGDGGDYNS